jgi:putative transposase
MARHLRVEYPGAIYHVTCRMIGDWKTERSLLFRDDPDRERFVEQLSARVEQCQVRLFLFACMTNHFHLVFETPAANCSKFMQSLLTSYTVYYNLRHGRHGHLLDGRFKAKLVDGDHYLLALSRYVHLNPVQVGPMKNRPIEERIAALRNHAWSSYPSYVGLSKTLDFVDYEPLLSQMEGKRRDWPKRYREFVESGLAQSDADMEAAMKQSPRSIGSDEFRTWIDALHSNRVKESRRIEDASFRRVSDPLQAGDVLATLAEVMGVESDAFTRRSRGSPLRAAAAHYLMRYSGCSQRDVADMLRIGSGAAVSLQLSRLPRKLAENPRLQKQFAELDKRLQNLRNAPAPQRRTSP